MICECGRVISDTTVPPVDWQGNYLPAQCRFCEIANVYSREKRRKASDTSASAGEKETTA